MHITLNGQRKLMPDNLSINQMVEELCKDKTPVIAEVNGIIVKKPEWEQTALRDGDTIELVSFVGGG